MLQAWAAAVAAVLIGAMCVGGEAPGTSGKVPELEVYRMIQYDQGDAAFGSRKSNINSLAVSSSAAGDTSRRVVVLEFGQVTEALLDEMLEHRPVGALLIILPEEPASVSDKQRALWGKVEANLMNREVPIAVYFAFDGEQAKVIKARVERNSGDVQLVVDGDKARKLSKLEATNYQGVLAGGGESKESGSSDSLPIIAIIANQDTFGISPGLAMGADSNGSGMIAVMQLARLFSKLYGGSRTRGNYNLMFVLTAAGRLNYAGTKHWLSHTDTRLLDNVEFAVCLDSIGSGDKLYMHASKPPKDATLSQVFSTFSAAAQGAGMGMEYVHKKINISDPTVFWEHEQFSRKRILAFTLSGVPKPDFAARSSILDLSIDQAVLRRNIAVIASALAKHIYKFTESVQIFEGSSAVQEHFVAAWSEALSREPRVAGYMDLAGAELVARAGDILSESCSEASKQTFKIDTERVYYRGQLSSKMSVYTVRPITFDIVMMICVIAYLLGLLVLLQGPAGAKKTLSDLFKGKGAKSKKRA